MSARASTELQLGTNELLGSTGPRDAKLDSRLVCSGGHNKREKRAAEPLPRNEARDCLILICRKPQYESLTRFANGSGRNDDMARQFWMRPSFHGRDCRQITGKWHGQTRSVCAPADAFTSLIGALLP